MSAALVVRLAESDTEIRAGFETMRELRTQLPDADSFLLRVREQMRTGYRLAVLRGPAVTGESGGSGDVLAVAGFRILEGLAWGRYLYVDDLVTRPAARSRGCGAALLAWLAERARAENCAELHLDSGSWRTDAHRFYEREGLEATSLHFRRALGS